MEKDYRFQYVPSYIIDGWKDEKGNIPYVTRISNEVFTSPVEDTFIEHLDINEPVEALEKVDVTGNRKLIDFVTALKGGDFSSLENGVYWASALMNHILFSNPYWSGRVEDLTRNHYDELVKAGTAELVSALLSKYMNAKRTTEDIIRMREMASTAFVYGLDLNIVVLEAPDTVDFALGDNPSFFFNPSDNSIYNNAIDEIAANGVAAILPLSPRYALCLYDGASYKVRKREGKVEMSEEDMLTFNTIMARSGISCVFSPTEKYGDEYYAHLYESIGDAVMETKNPEFSIFRVLAAAYDCDNPERDFAIRMMSYDSTYPGKDKDDGTFFNERIRYALSLASKMKS